MLWVRQHRWMGRKGVQQRQATTLLQRQQHDNKCNPTQPPTPPTKSTQTPNLPLRSSHPPTNLPSFSHTHTATQTSIHPPTYPPTHPHSRPPRHLVHLPGPRQAPAALQPPPRHHQPDPRPFGCAPGGQTPWPVPRQASPATWLCGELGGRGRTPAWGVPTWCGVC